MNAKSFDSFVFHYCLMMTSIQQPPKLLTTVKLSIAAILLGLINRTISYAYRNHSDTSSMISPSTLSVVFIAFIVIIYLLLIGFVIYKVNAGKNWARLVYSILFISEGVWLINKLNALIQENMFIAALTFIQLVLIVLSILFLFSKQSNLRIKAAKQ